MNWPRTFLHLLRKNALKGQAQHGTWKRILLADALFLSADHVAKLLGISISSAYELMQESSFPVLKVGNRKVVPKEKFRAWVEKNVGGGDA